MWKDAEKRTFLEGLLLGYAAWAASHGHDCQECRGGKKCQRWWEKNTEIWNVIDQTGVLKEKE